MKRVGLAFACINAVVLLAQAAAAQTAVRLYAAGSLSAAMSPHPCHLPIGMFRSTMVIAFQSFMGMISRFRFES